jgi:hypothetical protein
LEELSTAAIVKSLQKGCKIMEDLDANLLAWANSQMQEEYPQQTVDVHQTYDWEKLLRWKSQGPESLGLQLVRPRIISMADAWIWILLYPPQQVETMIHQEELLALSHSTYSTPLGLGLTEDGSLCTCYSIDLGAWTVVEELEGGFQALAQADIDCYHPHRYPDLNFNVVLDLSQQGGTYARYAQDTQIWNHYNACCMYRGHKLQIITIRAVREGERLNMPKGSAHWYGHADGMSNEHSFQVVNQEGSYKVDCQGKYCLIKDFSMTEGMIPRILLYEHWTSRLRNTLETQNGEEVNVEEYNFDNCCLNYFRLNRGMGVVSKWGKGVFVTQEDNEKAFPPFAPD